jgi:hypothetical protein
MTPEARQRKTWKQYLKRCERAGLSPLSEDEWTRLRADGVSRPGANYRFMGDGRARVSHPDFDMDHPPSEELTAQEIIEWRKKVFRKKREYEEATRHIDWHCNLEGPIGILHFGDPHVDDDGTDWDTLESHIELVQKTPGLFAGNIGDTTNNWVGRLARLYGSQSTTSKQAWVLAEHFIRELRGKWVYHVLGNHDDWSGDGNPLLWICKDIGAYVEQSKARIQLNFPKGESVVLNARHDFSGSSQWNPTHGPMKAAQLGIRDEILICGHKHKSGYSPLRDPADERVMHCIQVASYKVYDRYAREKGFRDQSLGPCVTTIIDPTANYLKRVQVFWDAHEAADYLTFKRGKK